MAGVEPDTDLGQLQVPGQDGARPQGDHVALDRPERDPEHLADRELEEAGFRLAVSEAALRYRQPARYDDEVWVRCWAREAVPRRVTFGYAVEHVDGRLLLTATVALLCLDADFRLGRLPSPLLGRLVPIPDPVRL